jgi:hypothetical protein
MRTEKYEELTRTEMVERLEARGYSRVAGLSKGRLLEVLVKDDAGQVDERVW